jgi:hypothetical protein
LAGRRWISRAPGRIAFSDGSALRCEPDEENISSSVGGVYVRTDNREKGLLIAAVAALAMSVSLGASAAPAHVSASAVPTHRSGCHTKHTCPSEHASYRWQGLLCLADRRRAE